MRIALYGEIDMNLIDSSSVWLQSLAQVLTLIPETEVTILLRRPEKRDVLTAPLRASERIEHLDEDSASRHASLPGLVSHSRGRATISLWRVAGMYSIPSLA